MSRRRVARSATSGQFISIADANRRPATSVIETIDYPSLRRCHRRRAARHLTEENQNERPFKADKDI